MGSSTRKYNQIAKNILKEGNINIQEGGKGFALAMKGVLKNGHSSPRQRLVRLTSSSTFKQAIVGFSSIIRRRKDELKGVTAGRYNIIINEIIEESNFTHEYQRVALKEALRRVDFDQNINIWKIIENFFNILLRMFFSESVLEPVSDAISSELDEDTIKSELDIIEEMVDYEVNKEDDSEEVTEKEVEEELVTFINKVKLAFGGN